MTYLTSCEATMSKFDGGQLENLVDRFWNLEELSCPYDGAKIWA